MRNTEGATIEYGLTQRIIGCAIEVHKTLGGPGLCESIYESALCHELRLQNIDVKTQIPVPVVYKGIKVRDPMYIDLLVENEIILELKATEADNPVHAAQLLTYLRLTELKVGLLINFGRVVLKDGIQRVVNFPTK